MGLRIRCLVPGPRRSGLLLRWSRHFFFLIGAVALGYVGFSLIDARLYQAHQSRRFQNSLKSSMPSIGAGELSPLPLPASKVEPQHAMARLHAPVEGSLLGRIEIPTIGLAAVILEGTATGTLRRAAGHIPGTPLPGEQGNVAIAGHRDTFFRPLRDIRKNDEITLTTFDGSYRYRVGSTRVVDPEDTTVLDASEDAILTLVTCYPFGFVGPAPRRFVVRARWIAQ